MDQQEIAEAESNLLGFFKLLVEIHNEQNNDQSK